MEYAFIIPVYNRPEEVRELLQSLVEMDAVVPFEVVLVEDGSDRPADTVVSDFKEKLAITYLKKSNSGPGDSRNYGMQRAGANYFIILDSDCLLPPGYLSAVVQAQSRDYLHCFGGPDAAKRGFTVVQRAINYAMTSFFTTGGIRGGKGAGANFEPRSFNMGLSREAFERSGGFGRIHPGEDPDLSIRLRNLGYRTGLIPEAYVYHKRRIDFSKFLKQVYKFGMVRPILSKWHPDSKRLTFWFPAVFCFGLLLMACSFILGYTGAGWALGILYGLYFLLLTIHSAFLNKDLQVALLSPLAALLQFSGYAFGFIKSTILVTFSKRDPEEIFPGLFFKKTQP